MRAVTKIASAAALAVTLLSSSGALAQGEERKESEPLRPNRILLLSGAAVIAGSYIPASVVASQSGRDGDQYLYIPVAGPWVDLAVRGGCGPNTCGDEAGYKLLIVADGIGQLVGTALVIGSFFVADGRETRARAATTKPMVTPTVGRSSAGVALVGTF